MRLLMALLLSAVTCGCGGDDAGATDAGPDPSRIWCDPPPDGGAGIWEERCVDGYAPVCEEGRRATCDGRGNPLCLGPDGELANARGTAYCVPDCGERYLELYPDLEDYCNRTRDAGTD